jgi:pectin methylesterase-like acyl-CoA thioesterase
MADSIDVAESIFTNNVGGKTLRYDPIQLAGGKVLISLHSRALAPGQTYCVNIDSGVFKDKTGAEIPGLTNDSAWTFSTRAALPPGRAQLVVAPDNTGDFCTVQGAIDYIPDDNQTSVTISVRNGVYDGLIYIPPYKSHIQIIGEDRRKTILEGRNNDHLNRGRLGRALFSVDANDFTLENVTLHNTTPYHGSQAEALAVKSDHCLLRNDDFYSFQDTLMLSGSVYVTNCYVEGDVDFIWGQGTAFFDRCELRAVHRGYYVQARNPKDRHGYIFSHCKLTAPEGIAGCVLARIDTDRFPCSEAAFLHCQMGPQIRPDGWDIKGTNLTHLGFEEFGSVDADGKLLDVSKRNPAARQLSDQEAAALSDPANALSHAFTWPVEGK